MRINEVVKQTKLSKRTIYYYIEEQLITPEINSANGYYIFSEKDVIKLQMLQKLRQADFSIKDIQGILKHPKSTHVYLQKQMESLNQEKELLTQKLSALSELETQLPMFITLESLSEALQRTAFPDKKMHSFFSNEAGDAKLVSLYLWGSFLHGIPMTQYRQYLWDKVLKTTAESADSNIVALKQYLYSLPADFMDKEFAQRTIHINQIIPLEPETIPEYAHQMQTRITDCIGDESFLSFWKTSYDKYIYPSTRMFDSKISQLIAELSPNFQIYSCNIHNCCKLVYHWLQSEEGGPVCKRLLSSLEGYIDIEACHHGELAALFSLPDTFYRK